MPAAPSFATLDELRQLYEELSAKHCPYYKSLVRVKLSKKSFVTRTIVHSGPHADLDPKSHRGAVAVEVVSRHGEYTIGTLYTPQVSSCPRKMSPEWAVIFKIDCDLSRKKTGDIGPALAHYVSAAGVERAPEVRRLRQKLQREPRKGEGRPLGLKSHPVGDLLLRYGKKKGGAWDQEDFLTAWILANADALMKNRSFMGEKYREPTLVFASFGLDEIEMEDEGPSRIDYGLNIFGDD
jgi:hypothetical protein